MAKNKNNLEAGPGAGRAQQDQGLLPRPGLPWKIIGIQLDLARHMETVAVCALPTRNV